MTDDELTKEAAKQIHDAMNCESPFTCSCDNRITDYLEPLIKKAHAAGYAEAREQAAKVAEDWRCRDNLEKCYPCDCGGEVPQDEIPKTIRSMNPEGIMRLEGLGKDLHYPPDYVKDLRQEPEGEGK